MCDVASLPGQVVENEEVVEDLSRKVFLSAVDYVLKQTQPVVLPEHLMERNSFTMEVVLFPWDAQIRSNHDELLDVRTIFNSDEFRQRFGAILGKQASRNCTVHSLERDTHISANGTIESDFGILTATFVRDSPVMIF
jgi:hypothetical protein